MEDSEKRTSRGLLPSGLDARYAAQGAANLRVEPIPVVHTGLGRKTQPRPFGSNAVATLPPSQHPEAPVERTTSLGVSLQCGRAAGPGTPAASPRASGAELPRRRTGLRQFSATRAGCVPTTPIPTLGGVGGAGRECWPRSASLSRTERKLIAAIRKSFAPGFQSRP
jgi:hypothetical protein